MPFVAKVIYHQKPMRLKTYISRHKSLCFLSIPVVDSCDAVIELKALQLFAKWKAPFVILGEVRNEVLSEFERSFLLKGLVCVCGTLYARIFDGGCFDVKCWQN